ncbi:DUF1476 domain-containing protein [Enterovirga aerilata]|uniref:DUF1476 domain-containing protein n=1 Tax=Enterovirga aerilata TaxID=2730920 RepID=A0A849ICR4_9HYPH|nr:DUF1476 domain-containing protein [Enterovirga sp. DB1703]NNM73777.1 DUF1476 domain-containing protein [Enterovirga sp. DB1703]
MTLFDERERAFEAKFAHDEDRRLIGIARGHRLFAFWAADRMGFDESRAETYAGEIVRLGLDQRQGDAVLRRVFADLRRADLNLPESEVEGALAAMQAKAVEQMRFEDLTTPEHHPAL